MDELLKYLNIKIEIAEKLAVKIGEKDENIKNIYEERLKCIFEDIKQKRINLPSDLLFGYWYYFSPEGPWGVWNKYPDLVESISEIINLLWLKGDDDFHAYCRRNKIDIR
ncbi:hypothetical protein ACNHE5_07850 [Pandoraea pnomenusa]|uniref:hypothetical protein n=1 Tax=Pandoraea pnomenusa TaxID=93220 RepID=UPI001ACB4305|nr:hypothetical protein [Pandoraea pnomenusa]MBN9091662.1 hypothetical protein [Pandoraea pnomenusa]